MSELLTVAEVAGVMKMSDDAVTRIFARLPGVMRRFLGLCLLSSRIGSGVRRIFFSAAEG